ncbi:hypothetical protein OHA77_33570 [Streptosporangium sp. NBC_01639]|uniref:hypothetical protein n=1 Tax=Streptosporangium sp. NBC_01639 TaxID=2975948 RepID=UPI003865EB72|nr:hypothetical protein OHA77_33570 [Streptosporangium sp. NBC_01639]
MADRPPRAPRMLELIRYARLYDAGYGPRWIAHEMGVGLHRVRLLERALTALRTTT